MADKLRAMRLARVQDGESFGMLVANRQLQSLVKLDVSVIAAAETAADFAAVIYSDSPAQEPDAVDAMDLVELERGSEETLLSFMKTSPTWEDGLPKYPIGDEPGLKRTVATTPLVARIGSRGSGAYEDTRGNYFANYHGGRQRHGDSWPRIGVDARGW